MKKIMVCVTEPQGFAVGRVLLWHLPYRTANGWLASWQGDPPSSLSYNSGVMGRGRLGLLSTGTRAFEDLICLSRNCDYGVAVWNSLPDFLATRTFCYAEDGVMEKPGMERLGLSENRRLSFCMNEMKINSNYQFIAFCPACRNSFIVKIKARLVNYRSI